MNENNTNTNSNIILVWIIVFNWYIDRNILWQLVNYIIKTKKKTKNKMEKTPNDKSIYIVINTFKRNRNGSTKRAYDSSRGVAHQFELICVLNNNVCLNYLMNRRSINFFFNIFLVIFCVSFSFHTL